MNRSQIALIVNTDSIGPPEAQVRLIGMYCIVTGSGLTKDRLGGQVAFAWPGFSKACLDHNFGRPPQLHTCR